MSAGPIAPFYGQPGLGIQYKLDINVSMALKEGYLEMHAASCDSRKVKARSVRVHKVF